MDHHDQKEPGPPHPAENLAGRDRLRALDRRGLGQLHQQRHQVWRAEAVRGAGRDVQQDGMVRFWVRDQGPGIPPEAQKRLFVPFSQVGQVREAGHGLGLSIVRRIIEKLGGQVGVESQPGQGSLFFFTLPAAPADKTPAARPDRAISIRTLTSCL